jgi:hypothetical protein
MILAMAGVKQVSDLKPSTQGDGADASTGLRLTAIDNYKPLSPSQGRLIAPCLKPGSKPAEFRNFSPIKS